MDMNSLLYLKWITNRNLLYSTWNSAQCNVAAWMGGEFGGEWMYVCIAKSLCYSPVTITTLLISYTPIQNKKFKKKKKRSTGCRVSQCSNPGSATIGVRP